MGSLASCRNLSSFQSYFTKIFCQQDAGVPKNPAKPFMFIAPINTELHSFR